MLQVLCQVLDCRRGLRVVHDDVQPIFFPDRVDEIHRMSASHGMCGVAEVTCSTHREDRVSTSSAPPERSKTVGTRPIELILLSRPIARVSMMLTGQYERCSPRTYRPAGAAGPGWDLNLLSIAPRLLAELDQSVPTLKLCVPTNLNRNPKATSTS